MGDIYRLSVNDAAAIIGVKRSTIMDHIYAGSHVGGLRAVKDRPEDRAIKGYHGPLRWRVCSHDVLAFREYSAVELNAIQKYFDAPVDLAYICALQSVRYEEQRNLILCEEVNNLDALNRAKMNAINKLEDDNAALTQESEGLARKLSESEQIREKISLKNIDLYSQMVTLRSTIDTDTERIKDLESYQSILKDDLRMRDEHNINLTAEKGRLEEYVDKVNIEIIERDEQITQLQSHMDEAIKNAVAMKGEVEALEKANAILQEDKAMLHNESHKRGLKIKELLEQVDQLTFALQRAETERDNWRSFYTNLRHSEPVSIWQKIAWVFTH